MAYRRNFRRGGPRLGPRSRGGHSNFINSTEFSASNQRQFYGDNNSNDDESPEPSADSGDVVNVFKGSKRIFSTSVQSDLNTLKNFTKQFQNGEKKNWPKYIREMNTFFSTSESFPNTLIECPHRYGSFYLPQINF